MNDKCLKYVKYLLNDDIHSDYLIHNLDGDFMKLRSFQQTFKRICESADIPYYGLHSLRHTFTSSLVAKGANVAVVSRLLGHSSIKFTYDRYYHARDSDYKDVVNLL